MDEYNKNLEILNHLLVETFNDILKVEEQSLQLAADCPVTVTELHTLDAIGNGEPRTVTALAAAMRVTVSTMTIAINRMEKKGFVEKVRENTDRRVVRVKLTDTGRTLSDTHERFHSRMARAAAERLANLQALAADYRRIRSNGGQYPELCGCGRPVPGRI